MSEASEAVTAMTSKLGIVIHDYPGTSASRGRSVYLQGQLHSNESAAMLVLCGLVEQLDLARPSSRVRVVPCANPIGWHRYVNSGQGRYSANGTNWNRMFGAPLREATTIDDQLAKTLWLLSCDFDVVIDVHTPEFGWPHIYASSPAQRLATMDDIPHVIYGAPTAGPFDESHLRLRSANQLTPPWASVTLEIPSHCIPTEKLVATWCKRLVDELEAQAESRERNEVPLVAGEMVDVISQTTGAVVLHCQPGHILEQGAQLLTVHGVQGETETLRAPNRCIPVCFRRATVVQAGYWVSRVIAL
jgi:predicted deacylase